MNSTDQQVNYFQRYCDLTNLLKQLHENGPFTSNRRESSYQEVAELKATAAGYVWGWQDGGAAPRDTEVSWHFGFAYGVYAAEFALELRSTRMPIQDAFRSWLKHGKIVERYSDF